MSNTINNRKEWILASCKNVLQDKDYLIKHMILHMLNKTTKMFKYTGLPDTINVKDLETQLQVNGFAIWKEVEGKLYTLTGGLGGEPNVYYLPTKAIISNPALRYTASLEIDKECVVMLNDYYYDGLMPINNKYASLITEGELSLKYAIINARIPSLVQADNDNTAESAKSFFNKIERGEDYGIITSKEFFDGIKTHDFLKIQNIKDLIEVVQYLKGSWYNEIGIRSTFNMKREAINSSESSLNDNILRPFVDVMLECRKNALEKINKMFNTNITVELDSVWLSTQVDEDLSQDLKVAQVEQLEKTNDKKEENKGGEDDETVGNPDGRRENTTD